MNKHYRYSYKCGKCGLKLPTQTDLKKHSINKHKTWHGVKLK